MDCYIIKRNQSHKQTQRNQDNFCINSINFTHTKDDDKPYECKASKMNNGYIYAQEVKTLYINGINKPIKAMCTVSNDPEAKSVSDKRKRVSSKISLT